jgi:hypothetical protein
MACVEAADVPEELADGVLVPLLRVAVALDAGVEVVTVPGTPSADDRLRRQEALAGGRRVPIPPDVAEEVLPAADDRFLEPFGRGCGAARAIALTRA